MMINRFMGDIQKDPSNTEAVHGFDAFYYSQCLAGDDPRLEGKFGEEFRRCEAGNCKEWSPATPPRSRSWAGI